MAGQRLALVAVAALAGPVLATTAPAGSAPQVSERAPAAADQDWADRRLVTNADFEQPVPVDAPNRAVAGWTPSRPGRFVSIEHSDAKQGTQALRIRSVKPGAVVSAESEPIAVLPGESITVAAWARRVSGAAGTLTAQFWREDGTPIRAAYGRATVSADGDDWSRARVSRTVPDDAVRMSLVLAVPGVGVTLWDDVEVGSLAPSAYRLPDGGFEDPRDDPLHTHWTLTGRARAQRDDVWANERALELAGTADEQASATSFLVPAMAGDHLSVSAWAKVVSGAPGTLSLRFLAVDHAVVEGTPADYRRTPVGPVSTVGADDAAGWHRLDLEADVPDGATHLQLVLASAGDGTSRWDDVRVSGASDADLTAYRSALGTGSVLFVGDQKVEGYTGLSRVVHPGTKTGADELAGLGEGVVVGHPGTTPSRTVSTVLKSAEGRFRMWFSGTTNGFMESPDGVRWDDTSALATTNMPNSIIENPRYGQPGQPRYLGLAIGFADSPDVRKRTQNIYVYVSDDGLTWSRPTPDIPAIYGRDTVMVTWDPVEERFVANVKQWQMTTASPGTYHWSPRSAWVSFSDDFTTWTPPRPVFGSDTLDYATVAAEHPGKQTTSDVYSLPSFRYGEQVLATPWMQDISGIARIVNMGQDVSTEHIELASSQDHYTWSRPAREPIIAKGAPGEWDWGFMMTATSGFITEGDTVRMYYGAYAGEHACTAARIADGSCEVLQVPSRIGMVTWPRDRFVSLRSSGAAPGVVTTRVLDPVAGGQVHLNADGVVRVEVLGADGRPLPGYGLEDAIPVSGDTLDTLATWSGRDRLPSRTDGIRLRLHVSGDLYSYGIR